MYLLLNYLAFLLKVVTLAGAILFTLAGIIFLSKNKSKFSDKVTVTHLNKKFEGIKKNAQTAVLSKKEQKTEKKKAKKQSKLGIWPRCLKRKKALDNETVEPNHEKAEQKDESLETDQNEKSSKKRAFYLSFSGDIAANGAKVLQEKISAVLAIAEQDDEVIVSIESPGGVVHGYGLCASQLVRIKDKGLKLTAIVDKVAASGGYLMASIADQIIAAPFAIIGSIGVVAQMPNFNRWLKKHNIEYEQITAGEYKRTLTLFGENTDQAREKFQQDIDQTHVLFKQHVTRYRPKVNIDEVATGEFWWGENALNLGLIDQLGTCEDYLWKLSDTTNIYQIDYHQPKTLMQKLAINAKHWVVKSIF